MTSKSFAPALIALGANIPSNAGPPAVTLQAGLASLEQAGVRIMAVSSFYVTPAWPDPADPPFTNAVARIGTSLTPQALLALLHDVETAHGRIRSAPNAPRTLDLDLLDHDGTVMNAAGLILPHPRIAQRRFVLEPLAEIAPDWRHPVTGDSAAWMLARLS